MGTVLNTVLASVFILLFHQGVARAAWATILGNIGAITFYIVIYLKGKTTFSILPLDFKPSIKIYKEVL